jgi:hypothetical protein
LKFSILYTNMHHTGPYICRVNEYRFCILRPKSVNFLRPKFGEIFVQNFTGIPWVYCLSHYDPSTVLLYLNTYTGCPSNWPWASLGYFGLLGIWAHGLWAVGLWGCWALVTWTCSWAIGFSALGLLALFWRYFDAEAGEQVIPLPLHSNIPRSVRLSLRFITQS